MIDAITDRATAAWTSPFPEQSISRTDGNHMTPSAANNSANKYEAGLDDDGQQQQYIIPARPRETRGLDALEPEHQALGDRPRRVGVVLLDARVVDDAGREVCPDGRGDEFHFWRAVSICPFDNTRNRDTVQERR